LDFLHSWTAEEDAHGLLLETYLLLGGNGDHRRRMALRKQIIRQGWVLGIDSAVGTMAYTAIQELATQTFYLRVADAAQSEDPKLARALRRLAKDETLHMAFYRDAVKAHLDTDPNFIYPITDVIMKFQMPGAGMPNYAERTDAIAAQAGYDPEVYYTQVLDVLWKYWDIDALAPTLAEAREAQKRLLKYHDSFARITARWMTRHPKMDDRWTDLTKLD
jgi:acyl-[acyl-carrier-protein] desaturase